MHPSRVEIEAGGASLESQEKFRGAPLTKVMYYEEGDMVFGKISRGVIAITAVSMILVLGLLWSNPSEAQSRGRAGSPPAQGSSRLIHAESGCCF
jgi:hypothetical protein